MNNQLTSPVVDAKGNNHYFLEAEMGNLTGVFENGSL